MFYHQLYTINRRRYVTFDHQLSLLHLSLSSQTLVDDFHIENICQYVSSLEEILKIYHSISDIRVSKQFVFYYNVVLMSMQLMPYETHLYTSLSLIVKSQTMNLF